MKMFLITAGGLGGVLTMPSELVKPTNPAARTFGCWLELKVSRAVRRDMLCRCQTAFGDDRDVFLIADRFNKKSFW